MITHKFLMGRGRDQLSIADEDLIEDSVSTIRTAAARQPLVSRGEPVETSTLVLEGFVCRYKYDRNGFRQAVGIHVPGDLIDLHGFALKRLDHDIETVSHVKLATFYHLDINKITQRSPNLARLFWFSTLLDAAMYREWIFCFGRLGAEGRVAHFLCEMYVRLDMVGLVNDFEFDLPLTQPDIGEATGLSGVHVNRILRLLREKSYFSMTSRRIKILDYEALARMGDFDPQYLFTSGPIR